jgi:hypothetical protein
VMVTSIGAFTVNRISSHGSLLFLLHNTTVVWSALSLLRFGFAPWVVVLVLLTSFKVTASEKNFLD